jgi:epoxyqueuosine reductase
MLAMDDLVKQSSMIKAEARRLGFDGCGISHAEKLDEDARRLTDWLEKGYHGSMAYMENHAKMRVDPEKLVDGAQSVISVILNYFPSRKQEDPDAPVISTYAYGRDYHGVIRDKLKSLLKYIHSEVTPAKGRGFVDSAPVLDRAWAARAGLGWIGKNTNLISPAKGSFFFIGSLIVDIPLYYDKPIPDFCGDCNRCINACPTKAIVAPQVIDARKCISYLTIENKGNIDPAYHDQFHNRVFGCDICQDVCPWNRKAIPHQVKEFEPLPRLLEMTRNEWHNLTSEQYNHLFSLSAVQRAGFPNLQRNLAFISARNVPR